MLRKISGSVESLRSIAVTNVSGNCTNTIGSTQHQTNLRIGGQAVQMRTGSMVNIHPGDQVDVAVIHVLGANRAVAWHATSTGARGTIGIKELFVATGVGIAGVWLGLAHGQPAGTIIGLACLVGAGVMAWVQWQARSLVA